jgi:hypothetical protein
MMMMMLAQQEHSSEVVVLASLPLVHVHVPKRLRVMPQLRDVLLLYLRVA